MIKFFVKLSLSLAIVVLSGCATDLGENLVKDQERLSRFKSKETSKKDAYYLMGQPHIVLNGVNGESCWKYMSSTSEMAPSSMIPILGILVGGTNNKSKVISINFDKFGIYDRTIVGNHESTTLTYEGFKANDEMIKSRASKLREGIRGEMKMFNLPYDESKANFNMGTLIYSIFGFGFKNYDNFDCDLTYIKLR